MKLMTMLMLIGFSACTAHSQDSLSGRDSASALALVLPSQAVQGDTMKPPSDMVMVEREPVVIAKKEPVYPELAMRAGIEGKVWVKIWVDKRGMPHDVMLIKSDQEIFNAPALEAARQFRFTPAYLDGKPVDVWVSVPFKFRLAEKPETSRPLPDTSWGRFPQEVTVFIRNVLEGASPDSTTVNAIIPAYAQAVTSGLMQPLRRALKEQADGKHPLEESGRKAAFVWGDLSEDGRSGYLVAVAVKDWKAPNARHRFHTITFQQTGGRRWNIVLWHSGK
jgi:TonB family protein